MQFLIWVKTTLKSKRSVSLYYSRNIKIFYLSSCFSSEAVCRFAPKIYQNTTKTIIHLRITENIMWPDLLYSKNTKNSINCLNLCSGNSEVMSRLIYRDITVLSALLLTLIKWKFLIGSMYFISNKFICNKIYFFSGELVRKYQNEIYQRVSSIAMWNKVIMQKVL